MKSLKEKVLASFEAFYFEYLDADQRQLMALLSVLAFWFFSALMVIYVALHSHASYAAQASLPGQDASGQLEAAGILLKTLDTGIFKWGARLFAGLCIMSSAWALKEQRFGIAIICVIGAIIFGTAPKWVQNIFEVGGNRGVFSQVESRSRTVAAFELQGRHYV